MLGNLIVPRIRGASFQVHSGTVKSPSTIIDTPAGIQTPAGVFLRGSSELGQPHKLTVAGSTPAPATTFLPCSNVVFMASKGTLPRTTAGNILSTPQCSTGSSQSRPSPARAGKIMESAGQSRKRNTNAALDGAQGSQKNKTAPAQIEHSFIHINRQSPRPARLVPG